MAKFNALWIDSAIPQPRDCDKYCWANARSFHEAIVKLELLEFNHISMAYHLNSFYGECEMTGYDIIMWLADRHHQKFNIPNTINIHSNNPLGRARMNGAITNNINCVTIIK